jgi:hypothetical protein
LGFAEESPAEGNPPTAEDLKETEEAEATEETMLSEEPKEPELLIGKEYQDFQELSLALRLFLCVKNYPRSSKARYHELEVLMALELRDNKMDTNELSRREALKFIAAMPIEACSLSAFKPVFKESSDEILLQCSAGITACWGLRKTQDITFAAQTTAKYIPTLKEIAVTGSSQQRKEAAELLFQSFLLLAAYSYSTIVGAHNAVAYARQAEKYGKQAENPLLQIIALRSQSVAYEYAGHWKSALDAGNKAKYLLENISDIPIPLLIQSYVHAGLSNYQAYFGLKDEAEASLRQAHTTFFAQPKGESAPIWIDHSIGGLLLNDGRMHMHLGLHKEAILAFDQVEKDYANDTSIAFACRISVMIDQIIAELTRTDKPRNMDWCTTNWTKALNDARALGSRSKETKVAQVYTTMLALWPGEKDVADLRDLLIPRKKTE